jgi:hypothetical protein
VKHDPLPIDLPDLAGVNFFRGLAAGLAIVGLFALVFAGFAVITG